MSGLGFRGSLNIIQPAENNLLTEALGFRIRAWVKGFSDRDLGFRQEGSGFRICVEGSGFRVEY